MKVISSYTSHFLFAKFLILARTEVRERVHTHVRTHTNTHKGKAKRKTDTQLLGVAELFEGVSSSLPVGKAELWKLCVSSLDVFCLLPFYFLLLFSPPHPHDPSSLPSYALVVGFVHFSDGW